LIASTGYGQDTDRQRSEEAGFDYHLVKPIDPENLQTVLELLGRQPHSAK
jgi:CheY-like chemotaxis protein